MTIAVILSSKGTEVATVRVGTRVRDALAVLSERRIGALPVMEGDAIRGIFSERDCINCLNRSGPAILESPVDEVMTREVVTVPPSTTVLAALATMTNRRIRHLPVVESGQIRGIVSIGDLVKHRIERIEAEADALRDYIRSA